MNTLYQFIEGIEMIEPRLYRLLNGDEARRELEALQPEPDRSVLVKIGGVKASLIDEMELVPGRLVCERECESIPFVIVESGTAPQSKPTTESIAKRSQ